MTERYDVNHNDGSFSDNSGMGYEQLATGANVATGTRAYTKGISWSGATVGLCVAPAPVTTRKARIGMIG
jgi:hypothetical protein